MAVQLPPPSRSDALATAGCLLHFVASSDDLLDQFRAWIEHCPGDLDNGQLREYLDGCHDQLEPGCASPAHEDLRPERRPA